MLSCSRACTFALVCRTRLSEHECDSFHLLLEVQPCDLRCVLFPGRTTCLSARVQSASPRWVSWTWHQRRKRRKKARQKVKWRGMRWKMRWPMSDEWLANIVLSRSLSGHHEVLRNKKNCSNHNLRFTTTVRFVWEHVLLSPHCTQYFSMLRGWSHKNVNQYTVWAGIGLLLFFTLLQHSRGVTLWLSAIWVMGWTVWLVGLCKSNLHVSPLSKLH